MTATPTNLMQAANDAADYLRSLGARRVWLFGSLARGRSPDFRSDMDLAVEGLPGDRYFEAVGVLLGRLPCQVDLVEMERAPAALRRNILHFGRELTRAD
jgi:predicted nucleotidyltransferase